MQWVDSRILIVEHSYGLLYVRNGWPHCISVVIVGCKGISTLFTVYLLKHPTLTNPPSIYRCLSLGKRALQESTPMGMMRDPY